MLQIIRIILINYHYCRVISSSHRYIGVYRVCLVAALHPPLVSHPPFNLVLGQILDRHILDRTYPRQTKPRHGHIVDNFFFNPRHFWLMRTISYPRLGHYILDNFFFNPKHFWLIRTISYPRQD